MEKKLNRPVGELANRPLHFYWVIDCSGSMAEEKIGVVNHAIQESIQPMKDAAENNPNAQLYVRALKFATGASWLTAEPVRIEDFAWEDLTIDDWAVTDLGKAFEMIAAQLDMPPMPSRALPPVIVVLSDGLPTDDWKRPLEKLLSMPWGKKAVKVALAIGKGADRSVLEAFTGNKETVFDASNPDMLVHLIKWASTIASTVAKPTTQQTSAEDPVDDIPPAPLPIPLPIPLPAPIDDPPIDGPSSIIDVDVW